MSKQGVLSFRFCLTWLVAAIFLAGIIDDSFAQRRWGGGYRSSGGYRSGTFRTTPPRPMVPRYNQGPRYKAPAQLGPKQGIPRASPSPISKSVRPLPSRISPTSPVARMPSYAGRVTKAGSPIITGKSGKPYSIPQRGMFSTKMSLMSGVSRSALMTSMSSGARAQLKQRVEKVALGKQGATKIAGGGGSGAGNGSGTEGGNSGKGIKGKFNQPASAKKVHDLISEIKKRNGSPPPGYRGGARYLNTNEKLPKGDYKEYDVNPKQKGVDRGLERLVIDQDTGEVYYTNDHYQTFVPVKD